MLRFHSATRAADASAVTDAHAASAAALLQQSCIFSSAFTPWHLWLTVLLLLRLQEAPTPPLAEQEEKDPHRDMKGKTDCGALETGSGERIQGLECAART